MKVEVVVREIKKVSDDPPTWRLRATTHDERATLLLLLSEEQATHYDVRETIPLEV